MSVDAPSALPRASGFLAVDERDAAVAARIHAELTCAHAGGRTRLSKVSSLLHSFRGDRRAYPSTDEVAVALARAGITVLPALEDARRTDCVELSIESEPRSQQSPQPTVRASVWRQGSSASNVECSVDELGGWAKAPDNVLWFHVELPAPPLELNDADEVPNRGRPTPATSAAAPLVDGHRAAYSVDKDEAASRLLAILAPWCDGLQLGMVRDLITEDPQPKVQLYGDEQTGARGVSTVAVVARTVSQRRGRQMGSTELVMQTVESVVGDKWIVTAWHPTRTITGANRATTGGSLLREPFIGYAHHHWLQSGDSKTAGDLGIYLAHALTNTYDASHRMIERWMDTWELDFNSQLRHSDEHSVDAATASLSDLMSLVGEFQRKVLAFQEERFATADRSWFPRLHDGHGHEGRLSNELNSDEVIQLTESLHSITGKLEGVANGIRDDMNLMMLHSLQAQQKSGRDFQSKLERITALLLVPTLITGIFGANTAIPGAGRWLGFEIMLALMIVSAVAIYGFFSHRRSGW